MDLGGRIICDHYVGVPAVNYTLESCPRCMSTGTYGGFSPSNKGDIPLVEKLDYLRQSLEKVFIENKRNTGYGFDYNLLVGIGDPSSIGAIKREVKRCVLYLRDAQQLDKKAGTSYFPIEEIYDVRDVQVFFDAAEPRRIQISLNVITVSGRNIDVVRVLER